MGGVGRQGRVVGTAARCGTSRTGSVRRVVAYKGGGEISV